MGLLCNAYFSNIDNNKNVFPIKCSNNLISFVWLDTLRSAASNFAQLLLFGVCGITFCDVVFNERVFETGMIIIDKNRLCINKMLSNILNKNYFN